MTIINDLLVEVVREYKVESSVLERLITSVSTQHKEHKNAFPGFKAQFKKFVEKACAEEQLSDLFLFKRYEQALGSYFGKKKGYKKKVSESWEVAVSQGRESVRVKVGEHTWIDFRIVKTHRWHGGKKVEQTTLDTPTVVYPEGLAREVHPFDSDTKFLAEKRARAFLKLPPT